MAKSIYTPSHLIPRSNPLNKNKRIIAAVLDPFTTFISSMQQRECMKHKFDKYNIRPNTFDHVVYELCTLLYSSPVNQSNRYIKQCSCSLPQKRQESFYKSYKINTNISPKKTFIYMFKFTGKM